MIVYELKAYELTYILSATDVLKTVMHILLETPILKLTLVVI